MHRSDEDATAALDPKVKSRSSSRDWGSLIMLIWVGSTGLLYGRMVLLTKAPGLCRAMAMLVHRYIGDNPLGY